MIETRSSQIERTAPRTRQSRRWQWRTALAVLIATLVVEGQPVAASYATPGPAGRVVQAPRAVAATTVLPARDATTASTDTRPDFVVTFTHLDDAQVGRPFSYTLQVQNEGSAGGPVSLSTVLPPELSNVRVTAPGFACTRRFSASGPQAGTLVTCTRNDLESGESADVTIEANAPATLGAIHLTATADPRDDVAEADETNNAADVTVQVHN